MSSLTERFLNLVAPTVEPFQLLHEAKLPRERAHALTQLRGFAERASAAALLRAEPALFAAAGEPDVAARAAAIAEANAHVVAEFEQALAVAAAQSNDSQEIDLRISLGNFYCQTHEFEAAEAALDAALALKHVDNTTRLQALLARFRIALFAGSPQQAEERLAAAEQQFKESADWESKNRLLVYRALLLCRDHRDLKRAADLLAQCTNTFNAHEVLDVQSFVQLVVLLCTLTRPRKAVEELIQQSSLLSKSLPGMPAFSNFVASFVECRYQLFYPNLLLVCEQLRRCLYTSQQYKFYLRESRHVIYKQFLRAYQSMHIAEMARAFAVGEQFIEDEVVSYIESAQLPYAIDKPRNIIVSKAQLARLSSADAFVASADELMNKIQVLSKIIMM